MDQSDIFKFNPRMEFAISICFNSVLSAAHSSEGDTFFNHPEAYSDWSGWVAGKYGKPLAIQVREPRRDAAIGLAASRYGASEDDPSTPRGDEEPEKTTVFGVNWRSKLKLELHDFSDARRIISTTQGRLFHTLWTGDVAHLQSEDFKHKPPVRLAKVGKLLEDVPAEGMRALWSQKYPETQEDLSAGRANLVLSYRDTAAIATAGYQYCQWFRSQLDDYRKAPDWQVTPAPPGTGKSPADAISARIAQTHPAIDVRVHCMAMPLGSVWLELLQNFSREFHAKKSFNANGFARVCTPKGRLVTFNQLFKSRAESDQGR